MFGFMHIHLHMPPNFLLLQLKKHVIDIFLNLILTACTRDINLSFRAGTITFFNLNLTKSLW